MRSWIALLAVISGCAASAPPAAFDPSTVHIEPGRRGTTYVVVSDDDGRELTDQEFTRMYRERTGSSSLDQVNHPNRAATIVGATLGGLILAGSSVVTVSAIDACEHGSSGCAAAREDAVGLWAVGAVVLVATILHGSVGSTRDHDLTAAELAHFVREYNEAPPRPARDQTRVTPVLGPAGVGLRF